MAVDIAGRSTGLLLIAALIVGGCSSGMSEEEVEAVFLEHEARTAALVREEFNPFVIETDQGQFGEGDTLGTGDGRTRIAEDSRLPVLCEELLEIEVELADVFADASGETEILYLERRVDHANELSNAIGNGYFAGLYDLGMLDLEDPSVLGPTSRSLYPFAWQGKPGEVVVSSDGVLDGMTGHDVMFIVGLDISGEVHTCMTVSGSPIYD